MWSGFPSWKETAQQFQRSYRKYESKYDREKGQVLFEGRSSLTCSNYFDKQTLKDTTRNWPAYSR